jgi:hypothetical protein
MHIHPNSYIKSIEIDNINCSEDDIRNLVQHVKTRYKEGIDYKAHSTEVWRDGHIKPGQYELNTIKIQSPELLNDKDFNVLLNKLEQISCEADTGPFDNVNYPLAFFVLGIFIFVALFFNVFSSR